ncbi:MAG: glycosyltransferase family 39 protein [Clostridia bacterium]|nr:glycosyltransferase family 39 protein [Clostridia bacterium]
MSYLMKVLPLVRLVLFIVSTVGTWEFLRRKTGVSKYFIPALAAGLQSLAVILLGGLGLLVPAAYAVLAFGLVAAGLIVWRDKDLSILEPYTDGAFTLVFVFTAAFAVFCWESRFGHWDSFVHWGIVVKNMFQTGRLPNAADTFLTHWAYPLGSAAYLYYWVQTVMYSEPVMMIAQAFLMTAAILPLYGIAREHKKAGLVVLVLAIDFFFAFLNYPTELLVDMLLALSFGMTLVYLYRYAREAENTKALYLAAVPLTMLMQIKSSGTLFCVIAVLFLLGWAKQYGKLKQRLIVAAVPFASLGLWKLYLSFAFAGAKSAKHGMSVAGFREVFGEKSQRTVGIITEKFVKFAVTRRDFWLVFAFLLLLGLCIFLFAKRLRKLWAKCAVFSAGLYFVYSVGLLGMFLFSMPEGEALNLAGGERYINTVVAVLAYLLFALLLRTVAECETRRFLRMGLCLVSVGFTFLMLNKGHAIGTSAFRAIYNEDRIWLNLIVKENGLTERDAGGYTLLTPEKFDRNMLQYVFMTDRCSVKKIDTAETTLTPGQCYGTILVRDPEDPEIKAWVAQYFPGSVGKSVIVNDAR